MDGLGECFREVPLKKQARAVMTDAENERSKGSFEKKEEEAVAEDSKKRSHQSTAVPGDGGVFGIQCPEIQGEVIQHQGTAATNLGGSEQVKNHGDPKELPERDPPGPLISEVMKSQGGGRRRWD